MLSGCMDKLTIMVSGTKWYRSNDILSQQTFVWLKAIIETLGKDVKYVKCDQ